jgi:hypothetical protein
MGSERTLFLPLLRPLGFRCVRTEGMALFTQVEKLSKNSGQLQNEGLRRPPKWAKGAVLLRYGSDSYA